VLDYGSLWSTVGRTHGWETLPVEGRIPPDLAGTFIRTGPGLFERFGRRIEHAFEADGVMVALRIENGRAEGAVRVVESPGYHEEERCGRPRYGSTASWWRRVGNGIRGRTKATGNTALMTWQDRTFALMEAGLPLEVDATELSTMGTTDLGGVVKAAFCAHPHRIAALSTTFGFGLDYGPRPTLALYALPDEGPARRVGRVALPWNGMVHDFAVTHRHAIFIVCPIKLRMMKAVLGLGGLSGLFSWDADEPALLLVVPLDEPERVVRIPVDPRFIFHFANAHEHDAEVVADFVQYPDAEVILALSGNQKSKPGTVRPRLQRMRIDLRRARVLADEVVWDETCEFPVVPAPRAGQTYDALWLTCGAEGLDRGLARLDPTTGAVDCWRPQRGLRASEPMFVPRPDARTPDAGWLVSLVLDAHRKESHFAIFDAAAPSAGPLARISMGQPLHATYHGIHIPAR
jgi:all-trans-8'-apo-beta-carotenal 15,15'-oxygenase